MYFDVLEVVLPRISSQFESSKDIVVSALVRSAMPELLFSRVLIGVMQWERG